MQRPFDEFLVDIPAGPFVEMCLIHPVVATSLGGFLGKFPMARLFQPTLQRVWVSVSVSVFVSVSVSVCVFLLSALCRAQGKTTIWSVPPTNRQAAHFGTRLCGKYGYG